MTEKKVSATVIMHMQDGSKKFLVHMINEKQELVTTDMLNERTGLANILDFLKTQVHLDISQVNLVELTNGQIRKVSIPLFVFETAERDQQGRLPDEYSWEEPHEFRKIIQEFDIEGMPFF